MRSLLLFGLLILSLRSALPGDEPPAIKHDLDGDGRAELIGVRRIGETDDHGEFYQLVVWKADGSVLWQGPRKMDPEAPLAFGSWHFGGSVPDLVGDIDGDGVVELVAEAPRSDVSAAYWRVFRWRNGAFAPAFTSALLPVDSGMSAFRWSKKSDNAGVWVNRFLGKAKGGWRVEVWKFDGGADVRSGEAVLAPAKGGGFKLVRWTKPPGAVDGGGSGDALVYRARLSGRDHFNSSGKRLDDAVQVLRQDRFHVHGGKRDPGDEVDAEFGSKTARARFSSFSLSGPVAGAIVNGTPLVEVRIEGGNLRVTILEK